ncbi:hypothetical protein [Tistrella mobilis]|uniref:hypothetical protein n=1 Tax=Tistrella mobilis TaxID=171437 RepID=UPI0035561686
MPGSPLLLAPRAPRTRRLWVTTDEAGIGPAQAPDMALPGAFRLNLPDGGGCLDTFRAGALALDAVADAADARGLGGPAGAAALRAAAGRLAAVAERDRRLDVHDDLDTAILGNGGALAALRRVSRESARSSTAIDEAARLLARGLESLGPVVVVVPDAMRIDRPSLKILARAALLAPADSRVGWVWLQSAGTGPAGYRAARSAFLAGLQGVVDPDMLTAPPAPAGMTAGPDPDRGPRGSARTIAGACAWLADQNYDACLVWSADQAGRRTAPDEVDHHRLLALVLTNLGRHDAAIAELEAAVAKAARPGMRAHLLYMQALLHAKRRFDLERSDACLAQAHAELDLAAPGGADATGGGDVAMERAWLHNGQAMNALLRARFARRPVAEAFPEAYRHLCTAFEAVREGRSPDRTYLRFNLLGNMSKLMEIRGEYAVALDLIARTFGDVLDTVEEAGGTWGGDHWGASRSAMQAAIMARSGDRAGALPLFRSALDAVNRADRPLAREMLQRSVGCALLDLGRVDEAAEVFAQGLAAALDQRNRTGAGIHGAGLAVARASRGQTAAARDLVMALGQEDGLWLVDPDAAHAGDLSGLRPPASYAGLATSIPEIDLEELHPVSIARVLHGSAADIGRVQRRRVAGDEPARRAEPVREDA